MTSGLHRAQRHLLGSRLLVGLSVGPLLALVLAGACNPTALADSSDVLRWELVGHIADQPIAWLAVPPDGLASGVLFARAVDPTTTSVLSGSPATGGSVRRSRDGGKTWDGVPDAPGRVVLPPGGTPAFSLAQDAVYRSTDLAATWNPVAPTGADELLFSPGFRQDGVIFLHGADQLWRSTDAGLAWTNLDPGARQAIAAVRLSPAFASDHTPFVGSVSARAAGHGGNPPPTDNADSLGPLLCCRASRCSAVTTPVPHWMPSASRGSMKVQRVVGCTKLNRRSHR